MSQHMITLTQENEIRLANIKEANPSFKLSRWVQEAFNDDDEFLTVREARELIIKAENKATEERLRADNLKKLIDILKAKEADQANFERTKVTKLSEKIEMTSPITQTKTNKLIINKVAVK